MYGNGFFNPYIYQPFTQGATGMASMASTAGAASKAGLFSKFSFSGLLSGASKTLNVVNQAIPIFYQVRPMFNNAKTMFRIMGAVKDDGSSNKTSTNVVGNNEKYQYTNYQQTNNYSQQNENDNLTSNPTFFI